MPKVIAICTPVTDHLINVDHVPQPNTSAKLLAHSWQFGGNTASAVVASARQGLDAGIICAVGDDDMGKAQKVDFALNGVDTRYVIARKNTETPLVIALSDRLTAGRSFISAGTHIDRIEPEELDMDYVRSGKYLLLDSNTPATRMAADAMLENGGEVMPLIAGGGGVNPVTIAGVQGTLTRAANAKQWNQNIYQFTRLEPGMETQVAKDTQIVTAAADDYRDYIHIVWLGTYGNFTSPERLVSDTKLLLQRQNINTDRFLVIGPCAYNGTWSGMVSYPMDSVDSAMLQAFGDRYINLRKYLMEDGMRDAGLSVTSQDKQSINNGCVPNSFRSNASGADLNGVAYDLLGKLVFERMDRLGYLDEVREQLNLEKSIQEILKEDPAYFENRLKAY